MAGADFFLCRCPPASGEMQGDGGDAAGKEARIFGL